MPASDADLDAEPEVLMCPITRTMFRDPVMVVDSGHTYERSAILSHFERNGAKDPLTNRALSSTKVMTNWAVRQFAQDWLDRHPGVTPDGWDSRELLEPSKDDGTVRNDDEGDAGVLRTWRAMCPELQALWPEAARPEHWEGVTIENGRVVELVLEEIGLTGAVPAEIGRLSALRHLNLYGNQLTSLPAEIGQLTSLKVLHLYENQLTSVPAGIGQLAALEELSLTDNQLTSVPAEIGQLTSLKVLYLFRNQLTTLPARIRELRAAGCEVYMDDGVTTDEGDDARVLRTWRAMCPELQERWPEAAGPEGWDRVTIENGQVVGLELQGFGLTGAVPAEIGQLTALKELWLSDNKLTSLPAEIGQLTLLKVLWLDDNQLTSLPAEIGQLVSLKELYLSGNQLTSLPAEIGQLTSLTQLDLHGNQLTSLPVEIRQLTSLGELDLRETQLTSLPAAIGKLRALAGNLYMDDGVTFDE